MVGSCSNCILAEELWDSHQNWYGTVGGPFIRNHDPQGTTLYGLDITVHPDFRKIGIGRAFYEARFELVDAIGLRRFGTGCRLPDFAQSGLGSAGDYALEVVAGKRTDRTLTPLLRYGLLFKSVRYEYMEDVESGNAAAILECKP